MASTVDAGRRFVGRDAALAMTGAALDDASAGAGQLLLVSGEPGIGKSALLAEQGRRAAAGGVQVVRGICWEGAGAPPYWLWTQVLRAASAPVALLLDHPAPAPTGGAAAADSRFHLFDAVGEALAGASPLLVILDDLHWADDPSLQLLDYLRRRLAGDPVLLLGAYRDSEAGEVLRGLAGSAPVLPLAGLDTAAVAALMAAVAGPVPTPELAAAVRGRCGGNPFFVRELTRLMVARGEWTPATASVPDGVRDTLRLRLARLSRPCTALLEIAAVAGSDVAPAMLAGIAPGTTAIGDLLDEAERGRVLVAADGGLRFAHDLYRETVLTGIPSGRRAELHAVVGHALHVLAAGGSDPAAVGGAARLAAHFAAAGPAEAAAAVRYSVLAAQEATARLGHEDAARHYTTALGLLHDTPVDAARRVELLLGLAAARDRAGDADATREAYLRVAELARRSSDPVPLATAALGVAALGARWGTDDAVGIGLLTESAELLVAGSEVALRSRVLAALARAHRHAATGAPDPRATAAARDAVELARTAGDPAALAHALLAQHDVMWAAGTATVRLPLLAEMAAAAEQAGDRDLVAEALLLRAAALIELGDPDGRTELARYTRLAEQLGHARGRWGALSRRATLAQLAGRVEEAVTCAGEAMELGQAIGLPDAMGCFATLRCSLAAIGGPAAPIAELMPAADPLWPAYPLLQAWVQVQAGDRDGASVVMHGFSVRDVPAKYDLEMVAVTGTVFAAVGSDAQREWAYETFTPFAGLHAVVGGCAAYHGVVDHHLGLLASALGRTDDAIEHFSAAIALHERLGTAAWAELSRAELARLRAEHAAGRDDFRLVDGMWLLAFDGREVRLPDAKGLRDIATLLAAPGRPVHVHALLGCDAPAIGADPVLDRRAVAAFRARLTELAAEIDEAQSWSDPHRAERADAERDAIMAELHAASGLGGRARRLGDEVERARKTVTARIRDALRRIDWVHPDLAAHLRAALHTGTSCSYSPEQARPWRL